jgi:hypothetical protein
MGARIAGYTLTEVGKAQNLSAERVRQIETRATDKLRRSKGKVALACIRDLVKRRGYQKPYRPPIPFRSVKYPLYAYEEPERETFAANRPDLLERSGHRDGWWEEQHFRYALQTIGPNEISGCKRWGSI